MTIESISVFFLGLIAYWITKIYNTKVKYKRHFIFLKYVQSNALAILASVAMGGVAYFVLPSIMDVKNSLAAAAIAGYFNASVVRFLSGVFK
jgi:hypothetical protein